MSYKEEKEIFVANNIGDKILTINLNLLVGVLSLALYSILVKRFNINIVIESLIITAPTILSLTLLNDYLISLNLLLIVVNFLITGLYPIRSPSRKSKHKHSNSITPNDFNNNVSWKNQPPSPLPFNSNRNALIQLPLKSFITNYRSYLMFITVFSILAVDFPIFPRKLSKTELFGTSLMDLGVGAFTFSLGLVDAKYIINNNYRYSKVFPLALLGLIRLIMIELSNYPQHASEYGIHWNFFLTLSCLPVLTNILFKLHKLTKIQFSWFALIISLCYQLFLSKTRLQSWLISDDQSSLLAMNKQGIFSLSGYLSIYLIGLDIGLYSLPLEPYFYFTQKIKVKSKHDKRDKLLTILLSYSILYWTLLGITKLLKLPISRRFANLPYTLWIISFNITFLTMFLLIDIINFKLPSSQQFSTPRILNAINNNSLIIFLVVSVLNSYIY